jgi:hypothetical protein
VLLGSGLAMRIFSSIRAGMIFARSGYEHVKR